MITKDQVVLNNTQGCIIEFTELPVQISTPHQLRFSEQESEALNIKISELLKENVISECAVEKGDYINTVFLREKRSNDNEIKYRIILNMKTLNKNYVEKTHHKMESLKSVLDLMEKDCFMASIDLKNAFHTIPMDPEFTKYLKFQINDTTYKYLVLPMGFTSSPRLFCRILKPVLLFLRKQSLISSVYIDDFYLQGASLEECEHNVQVTLSTLNKLGFEISDKSMLIPNRKLEHLGFVLNSEDMTVHLSDKKRIHISELIKSTITSNALTVRDIAIIVGTLIASFPAVKYGPLFHRELEILKTKALKINYNFELPISLNSACLAQLNWWLSEGLTSGNVISHGNPDYFVQSDSSGFAWGALRLDNNKKTQGIWDIYEAQNDINYLETKAALLGVMAICNDIHDCHLQIQIDNITAVTYINNMGGVHSLGCNNLTQQLLLWCKSRKIWISSCHIAGKDNVEADFLSRKINDNIEWTLDHNCFEFICAKLGKPTIDMFASRINTRLPRYISFMPDAEAIAINAFHHKWEEFAYIFPPFNLVPRVLKKIKEDQTKAVILVFPRWEGAFWFPQIYKMCLIPPLFLKHKNTLLQLSHKPGLLHPLMPKLRLMAALLSGRN